MMTSSYIIVNVKWYKTRNINYVKYIDALNVYFIERILNANV